MQLRTADVSWRDVEGDVIVLDERTWKYVHLNPAASLLWRSLVSGPKSQSDLADALAGAFGIAAERAAADVTAFVEELRVRDYLDG